MSFDIIPVMSLRQFLMYARLSLGSQQSVAPFFPEYRFKCLAYDTYDSFLLTFYGKLGTKIEMRVWMRVLPDDSAESERSSYVNIFGIIKFNG